MPPKIIIGLAMAVVSTLLSILLPKPKKTAQPDPTSPNVGSGSSAGYRIFGTAVVGGAVIDNTTPELQDSGGKGGSLGGGKAQSEEIKTGSFCVFVGEGERPWNSLMRSGAITTTNIAFSVPSSFSQYSSEAFSGYTSASASVGSGFPVVASATFVLPGLSRVSAVFLTSPDWNTPAGDEIQSVNFSVTNLKVEIFGSDFTTGIGFDCRLYGVIRQGEKTFISRIGLFPTITSGIHPQPDSFFTENRTLALTSFSEYIISGATASINGASNPNPLHACEIGLLTGTPLGDDYFNFTNPTIRVTFNTTTSALSYTVLRAQDGKLSLKKIWMNDQLWYDSTNTNSERQQKNSERIPYFTFYSGSLTQSQDPTFVALRGANKMPGYQGYSYIVYNNLPLDEWGNNYPTSKYLVTSSLPASPEVIVEDVMYRSGALYNKPLLEGKDWAWATDADTGARLVTSATYDGVVIDGYTMAFDSNDLKRVWNELGQMFRIAVVSNPTLAYEQAPQRGFIQLNPPMYKIIPLVGDRTIDVEAINLGIEDSSQELPWATGLEDKKSEEIPGIVEVQYYNNNKTGERESVSVDRSTYQIAGTYTFATNYFANRRIETANAIGTFILFQGLERARQLNSAVLPNTLLGMQTLVKWQDTAGNEKLSLRPQKIVLGANGKTEIIGISVNPSPPAGTIPPDDIADISGPPYVVTNPEILWIEGYAFTTPTSGNNNVVNIWSVNKFSSPVSDRASILISADSGATFSTTSLNSIRSNAQRVKIDDFVPSTRKESRYYEIDRGTHIDVDVGQHTTLNSVDEVYLYDGTKNIMHIEGVGVVGFATATLISTDTYRLTNLLFNLGQSGLDVITPPSSWSVPAEAVICLAAPYELVVPSSFKRGDTLTLSAVTATASSGNLTRAFRKANASPRPPLLRHIQFAAADKSVEVAWSPSVSQSTLIVPDLFNDPLQAAPESYTIKFWEGSTLRSTFSGITTRFVTYSEAQQTTDGVVSRASLEVEIIQEGNVASLQNVPRISLASGLLV